MSGAYVFVDRSQFPERVREDLLACLHARVINHKFHYGSYKQAARWLALHEVYSPARRDESCRSIYDEAFAAVSRLGMGRDIQVVGLGCGGGQKEARLLEVLRAAGLAPGFAASDVSLPLTLTAWEAAAGVVPGARRRALVCDLATAAALPGVLDDVAGAGPRVLTLFGIIPNFDPELLMRRLSALVRPGDWLLLSANLAPGEDYAAGVERVLPQYDNELTREWLLTLLLDLGLAREDGAWHWSIVSDRLGLRRVTAHFVLQRAREIQVEGESFQFSAGERLQVFFSYRHTLDTLRPLLASHSLELTGQWINESGEEGVFLCRRAG